MLSIARGNAVAQLEEVDGEIRIKQQELLEAGNDQKKIDVIGNAIVELREERRAILSDEAARHEQQERVEELAGFLNEQREAITEYSEALVRRLIEKITVYDEKLTIEFKSGLKIDVEMWKIRNLLPTLLPTCGSFQVGNKKQKEVRDSGNRAADFYT